MSFWTARRTSPKSNLFEFEIKPESCAGHLGREFLMGGVSMAVAIEAAESFIGKPLLWASIQFISACRLGDSVNVKVDHLGGGNSVSQVRVSLTVEDKLIQQTSAALGGRQDDRNYQFVHMPEVRPPDECPTRNDIRFESDTGLPSIFERRRAFQCSETGMEYMWTRPAFDVVMSAALLGITSDFILGAHDLSGGGTSLDNSLRVYALKKTEWILGVIQMSGVTKGTAHGTMYQFAQDGTLLTTSSQTGLIPRTQND